MPQLNAAEASALYRERDEDPEAFGKRVRAALNALQARIVQVGLRPTARELGMSASGLAKLLDGDSEPRLRTVGKVLQWHAQPEA